MKGLDVCRALKKTQNHQQTSDEVSDLIIGQRIIVAATGGNFSHMTKSLHWQRKQRGTLVEAVE